MSSLLAQILIFIILCNNVDKATSGRNSARGSSNRVRIRGIRWWNLALFERASNYIGDNRPTLVNTKLHQLAKKQRRLVLENPGTMIAVISAAREAIAECKSQFSARRWNCSISDLPSGGASIFGKIVKKGCRQTAFLHAITSAALTHTIAKTCAEGSIHTCKCGRRQYHENNQQNMIAKHPQFSNAIASQQFKWQGCSDDSKFGNKFARVFTNVMEKGGEMSDLRYAVNKHNNEAGRLHAIANMKQECKCHGMSGSCSFKTCWRRMKSFAETGALLKERFDGASRVTQANTVGNVRQSTKKRRTRRRRAFIPFNPALKPPSRKDLVYFESSPSFCDRDNAYGLEGTKGRECNITSRGIDGCELLCCGRGYVMKEVVREERCHCKFIWCCKVECKTCRRRVNVYLCK